MSFAKFQLLGCHRGLQKPSFAKVPKTEVKPHFWSQIAVSPSPHKVRHHCRRPPPEAFQVMSFTKFQLLGPHRGLQKPKFAKVPTTLVKPHFWNQIAVLPSSPQRCRGLAAASPPEALQIMSFTKFQLLGLHSQGPTKAQFHKSLQNLSKTTFLDPPRGCRPLPQPRLLKKHTF